MFRHCQDSKCNTETSTNNYTTGQTFHAKFAYEGPEYNFDRQIQAITAYEGTNLIANVTLTTINLGMDKAAIINYKLNKTGIQYHNFRVYYYTPQTTLPNLALANTAKTPNLPEYLTAQIQLNVTVNLNTYSHDDFFTPINFLIFLLSLAVTAAISLVVCGIYAKKQKKGWGSIVQGRDDAERDGDGDG
jgi:hypothetical protein